MKKITSIVLLVSIIFGVTILTPMFDIKASAESEGIYTYSVTSGKATITYCDTSASGAIEIPSTLGGSCN